MTKAIRTATISFGLVAIPVKLFTSNETSEDIGFNKLHEADKAKLKQQYVCTHCNEVVDKEHTVKGHEHTPGQFVVFSEDELDALDSIDGGKITIVEFIPLTALDPMFVSGDTNTYYLAPDKGADRAFTLVHEAMEETRRVAIATYARGGQERMVAMRSFGRVLIIHELRYASEIRSPEGIPVPDGTSNPAQLRIAKQLIARMSSDQFFAARYTDSVAERRREMINAKIAGGEIVVPPTEPATNIVDMLEALKASLDKTPDRSVKRIATNKRDRKARVTSAAKKRKAG